MQAPAPTRQGLFRSCSSLLLLATQVILEPIVFIRFSQAPLHIGGDSCITENHSSLLTFILQDIFIRPGTSHLIIHY